MDIWSHTEELILRSYAFKNIGRKMRIPVDFFIIYAKFKGLI